MLKKHFCMGVFNYYEVSNSNSDDIKIHIK
jgi:hypothetical protein